MFELFECRDNLIEPIELIGDVELDRELEVITASYLYLEYTSKCSLHFRNSHITSSKSSHMYCTATYWFQHKSLVHAMPKLLWLAAVIRHSSCIGLLNKLLG